MIFVREFPDRSGRHCVSFVSYSLFFLSFNRFLLGPFPSLPFPSLFFPLFFSSFSSLSLFSLLFLNTSFSPFAENDEPSSSFSTEKLKKKKRKETKALIATRINWRSVTALTSMLVTEEKKSKKINRIRVNLRRATRLSFFLIEIVFFLFYFIFIFFLSFLRKFQESISPQEIFFAPIKEAFAESFPLSLNRNS